MKTLLGLTQREIEVLGHSLRRIVDCVPIKDTGSNSDLLPNLRVSQEAKKRIWYQGYKEAYFDIIIIVNGEEIEWFQFTLRGKALIAQRNPFNPQTYDWQVGKTNEGEVASIKNPATSLIYACEDSQFPRLVYTILQTRVGEKEFDQILKLFENWEQFKDQ